MFRNRIGSLALCWGVLLGTAFVPQPAQAAHITLSGAINTDDAVQLFDFTVAAAGAVDLRSYGYAGGMIQNDGVVLGIASGGFDTILTLFDASGNFLSENDDGAGVATDPSTGLAGDARITANLNAGNYILALTQYDNFARGSNLSDGFVEAGHPNFTADSSFATGGPCPGNLFRDISGTAGRCRNGNWTVDFSNVANVTPVAPVPEPSALPLAGVGLALLLASRYRRRRTAPLLVGGLVAALASGPVHAQTQQAANPDYSQVSDVLNGQRTLVQVRDLEAVYLNPSVGPTFSQTKTSNSNQTPGGLFNYGLKGIDSTKPVLNFSAHMFNQASAVTITTLHSYNGSFALWLQNINGTSDGISAWTPLAFGDEPDVNCGAVADFTQDGFDDLALGLADGRILVVSPNSTDPLKQPFTGSFHSTNPITTLNVLLAMAAGDFNGDGRQELAGLTVVPYDQPGGGGLVLVTYTVDPQSLAVTVATKLTLTTPGTSASNPITRASMARGRFNTSAHDQLAVAFATNSGPVTVEVIDFTSSTLTPVEKPALTASTVSIPVGYLQVQTGQFGLTGNPSNPYDQIVFHSSSVSSGGKFFEVLSADPTSLTLTAHSGVPYNPYPCAANNGVQIGNFDHQQPNQAGHDPDSQIAFMYCSNSNSYTLNIYNVNPSTFDIVQPPVSALPLPNEFVPSQGQGASFVATDLQGRSYILGAPTKVVVARSIQPSVIAAMPPMHVDFVPPTPGSEPEVLNLSVVPSGFNTTYQTKETNTNQSSTINTTSWSFGAQQSLGVGFEVGSVDAGFGLKGSSVSTAAQDLKGSIETEHGKYTQSSFDASVTTGFSDLVWYSSSRFNVWVYPVLGRTACPAGTGANCPQQKPLTIQFSAPDDLEYASRDGSLLPWYQPVWEPGNVFSYPANYQQLQAIAPNLNTLSGPSPRSFATDDSQSTVSINWTTEGTEGTSASFDQNYSFSQEFSLTGAVSTPFTSASFTGTLNFSGSTGFSDLNKSVTSVGKSTGISVNKPGSFANPALYAYSVTPYIFGQNQSASVVDEEPLNADVETHGLLRTAFLADPLAIYPHGWWSQTYNQPDIALNHPQRWRYVDSSAIVAGGPSPSNCLNTGQNTDCVYRQESNPQNPWLSPFHFMRGFFISNAQNPGAGPQLDSAQAGDQLTLQVRVYNYSLKAMPEGSQVHVRFYVQPLDKDNHNPVGESVLIGNKDVVLDRIPPFNADSAQLNWVPASTTFDTTPYGGQNLVFWVIVWAQNANGTLVQEMPGHGLETVPGVLKSFADVQMEEQYSNNVGFYNEEFYVFSKNEFLTASGSGEPATIDIGKIQLSSESAVPGQILDVSAQLSATDNSAAGVDAVFYDGDPNAGGTAFGYELSPYIAENDTYQVKAPYAASACGTHQLFIVVGQGTSHEIVRRAPPVRIDCSQSMLRTPGGAVGQRLNLK